MSSAHSSSIILLRGSCHNHSLTYISTALPSNLEICHCITCRHLSGSSSLTFVDFPRESVAFSSSVSRPEGMIVPDNPYPLQILHTSDAGFRGFYMLCGIPLFMIYHCEPEQIGIAVGTIDEGSVLRDEGAEMEKSVGHIFLREKAGREVLGDDDIERFEGFGGGFEEMLRRWEDGGRKKDVKPPVVQ